MLISTSTSSSKKKKKKAKHVGTGHADTSRFEWAVNMHRDTAASFVGHAHLANYLAVATNEHPARVREQLLCGMLLPCGLPPPPPAAALAAAQDDEDEDYDEGGGAKAAKKARKKKT